MRRPLAFMVMAAAATSAVAEPRFEPVSGPVSEHVYSGGWEHFVGGGVAVLDCNDDTLPDMVLAGGEGQTELFVNEGEMVFSKAPLPPLSGVTGAYPLDLDADGVLDLFVMRVGPNVALRGLGGCLFEDATQSLGLPDGGRGWTTAFSAWWEAGDARPTLAIGNYVDRDNPDGPFGTCDDNAILRPVEDGWTEEALSRAGRTPVIVLPPSKMAGRRKHYHRGSARSRCWPHRMPEVVPPSGCPTTATTMCKAGPSRCGTSKSGAFWAPKTVGTVRNSGVWGSRPAIWMAMGRMR